MKIIEKITKSKIYKNVFNVLALWILLKRENTPVTDIPLYVKILLILGIKYRTYDFVEFVRAIADEHLYINPSKEVVITKISYRYFVEKVMKRYNNDSMILYIVVGKEKYDILSKLKNKFYISHKLYNRNNIQLIFDKKDYIKLKLAGTFDT